MNTKLFEEKYSKLNPRQKEAVDTVYGPVMVVAGPGTGKTTLLTLRIANIILKAGAKPEEILAVTFTESGVKAMREKLREVIREAAFRVNIFTFHGFGNYMRAEYPESFAKIGARLPASETKTLKIIEEILAENTFKEVRTGSQFGLTIGKIKGRISDLKRELVSPDDLTGLIDKEEEKINAEEAGEEKKTKTKEDEFSRKRKHIQRLREFQKVYSLYEKKMEEQKFYDFDDTILGLIDALKKDKEMLFEMRENFQFILADEHQDANGAQNEVIKFFKGDEEANIFVVGDDKQSIFRFQGASLAHFYNFGDEFPKAKKIELNQNYRSHSIVLSAAHSLISKDGRHHEELSANASFVPKPLQIYEFSKMDEEFSYIAEEIKDELKKGNKNIAVLSRYNSALFEFASYLKLHKIPFSLKGEKSLFDNHEYLRIESLFRALSSPYEKSALLEALYFGFFDVPLLDVLQFSAECQKRRESFAEGFLSGQMGAGTKEPVLLFKKLSKNAYEKPLLEFLRILRSELKPFGNPEYFSVLNVIYSEAEDLVRENRKASLRDLLFHLDFLKRHELPLNVPNETHEAEVVLSSIHRSKGLEYDSVYIIDVVDKRFEKSGRRADLLHIPGIGIDTDLEEERRLFYVALTRARQHVTVSYSLSDYTGGELAPSALIFEIDESLLSKTQIKDIKVPEKILEEKNTKEEVLGGIKKAFLLRNFSVTAFNNYLDCPWKYFWRNLLLIPDTGDFSSMLGNTNHEVLRRLHIEAKKGVLLGEEEIRKIINESAEKEAFSEAELPLAKEKCEESIFAYLKTFVPWETGTKVFVEESLSFMFPFVAEETKLEVPVTGKLDLSTERNGEAEVIDFKSSKRKTRNEILGNTKTSDGNLGRQIKFYKFLWEESGKEGRVGAATLHFLSPERGLTQKEVFALSNEDKEQIKKEVEQTLKEIWSLEFWNRKCDDKNCEYCSLGDVFKESLN